jgi:hypothetical protein
MNEPVENPPSKLSAELSRLYANTPRDEPPAALDDAILARARREVGEGPSGIVAPASQPKRQNWGPPLALAAVVVLSVSLVLTMEHERPEGVYVPRTSNPGSSSAPAKQTPPESGTTDQRATSPTAAQPRANETEPPRARNAAPPGETSASKPVVPQDMPAARRAEPFPASPVPSRQAIPAETAQPNAGAGVLAPQTERRDAIPPASAPAAPLPAPAYAPAPVATPPASMKAQSARSATTQDNAVVPGPSDDSPQAWIARLDELKKQGRTREFRDSLAEFRKRYPAYPIPESLTAPE